MLKPNKISFFDIIRFRRGNRSGDWCPCACYRPWGCAVVWVQCQRFSGHLLLFHLTARPIWPNQAFLFTKIVAPYARSSIYLCILWSSCLSMIRLTELNAHYEIDALTCLAFISYFLKCCCNMSKKRTEWTESKVELLLKVTKKYKVAKAIKQARI